MEHLRKNILWNGIITAIGLIYLMTMPFHVQSLDTGELVTNSHFFRMLHAPGYPLYSWLYGIFNNFIPISTVFYRSSFLTAALSLTTLVLLLCFSKKDQLWPVLTASLITCLAMSNRFWKYSLLPDVFMLHALLVVLLVKIYIFADLTKAKAFLGLTCVFGLMAANHHTSIFLILLPIHALIRQENKKQAIAIGFGALLIPVGLYLSLFFLDSNSLTSWRELTSLNDLIAHFLRKDYGTFQLAVGDKTSFAVPIFKHFLQSTIIPLLPFVAIVVAGAIYLIKEKIFNKKFLILFICLVGYLLWFFPNMNIDPVKIGKTVVERFFLMPQILICCLAIAALAQLKFFSSKNKQYFLTAIAIGTVIFNIYANFENNNYSKNDIIETWAIHRLKSDPSPNTIFLETSDTSLFSMYYARDVLKINGNANIFSQRLAFHHWYLKKYKANNPQLSLDIKEKDGRKYYHLFNDLIKPNISTYQFNIPKGFRNSKDFAIHFLPIGRIISPGTGTKFTADPEIKISNYPESLDKYFSNFTDEGLHLSQYCFPFLARAMDFAQMEQNKNAIVSLRRGLGIIPYCYPALINLCRLNQSDACKELQRLKARQIINYY